MIRKGKAIGLAALAVCALSAVTAAAAGAAEGFNWPSGTTKLTAKQAAVGGEQVFAITAGVVRCAEVAGESGVAGTSSKTVTAVNIKYNDKGVGTCRGPFGTKPTIEMNGCDYEFKYGATSLGNITGTAAIKCPAGLKIKVNAPGCEIEIGEAGNGALGPITFNDSNGVDIVIEPAINNISYNHKGFLCGTGSAATGSYTGDVTVTGNNGTLFVE